MVVWCSPLLLCVSLLLVAHRGVSLKAAMLGKPNVADSPEPAEDGGDLLT